MQDDSNSSPEAPGDLPLSSRRIAPNSFKRLFRLCGKELREILRDRRTIVTLVLMPLLVYPILTLVFKSSLFSLEPDQQAPVVIAFESEQDFNNFQLWYMAWSESLDSELSLEAEEDEVNVGYVYDPNLRQSIKDGTIHLGIEVEPLPPRPGRREIPRIKMNILYADNSFSGTTAAEFMQRRMDALNQQYDRNVLSSGLPVRMDEVLLETKSSTTFPFKSFVPLMLILMTITGAVYPAIDLTAGERERGTMEALIAAPVPRIGLLIGKFVAVLVVAILTATANMLGMTITLMISPALELFVFGEEGIAWAVLAQIYVLMILFAAFFSAILLAITSFARSFKEAQAYLIPLMLVSLGPGILSLLPHMELTPIISVTPLLNLVLLSRDLIQGTANPLLATVAILTTCIYAVASISLAAKIFGTDAILYGSQASWSDLFRIPKEKIAHSSLSGAMLCLALLFPLQFVAASLVGRIGSSQPTIAVALEISEDLQTQAIDASAQLLLTNVPDDASLSEGYRLSSGDWSVSPDQVEGLELQADRLITENVRLSVAMTDAEGVAIDETSETIELTAKDFAEGLSIGRSALIKRLVLNALVTILLFVGVPLIAIKWQNIEPVTGLRLHRAHAFSFVGALLLGLSLWPMAHELVVLGLQVGIGSIEDKFAMVERLIAGFRGLSPFLILAAMALTPAICEEFFFRGFVLQSLYSKTNAQTAIVVSAVLFGVFHLIGASILAPERFLPTTFLGLVLGWICVRTGSVIPGMVLHAFHNGFLLMASYYRDELAEHGWLVDDGAHLPATWLICSAVTIAVGFVIVWLAGRRATATKTSAQVDEAVVDEA